MTVILLVEDEKGIRDTQATLFEYAGFEVMKAASATDAQKIIEHRHVDVLFSDIRLGRESGLDLAYWVHTHYPLVAVVLMTGYSGERNELRWPLLMKPFLNDEAVELINKTLALRGPIA